MWLSIAQSSRAPLGLKPSTSPAVRPEGRFSIHFFNWVRVEDLGGDQTGRAIACWSQSPVYTSRCLAEAGQPRHPAPRLPSTNHSLSTYYGLDSFRGCSFTLPTPISLGVRPQFPNRLGAAREVKFNGGARLGSAPAGEGEGRPIEKQPGGGGAPGFRCLCPRGGEEGSLTLFEQPKDPICPSPGTRRPGGRRQISPGCPCCPSPAPRSSRYPPPASQYAHCPQDHLRRKKSAEIPRSRECEDGAEAGT